MLGSFTFAFLCSSIALALCLVMWLWITIGKAFLALEGRARSGWDARTVLRLLDIALGAGIVNSVLSPLSVSFALYLLSVYVYEPRWRSHVLRCVHLEHPEAQADEVAALLAQDTEDESEGPWELTGVRTARGEPVRLPAPLADESSEGEEDEECRPCVAQLVTTSSSSGQSVAVSRLASSLLGVAKEQPRRCHPLIVDLRNREARPVASRVVYFLDQLLSVDSRLPVMRRFCREPGVPLLEEEEDDCETSDTGSASETSGPSTETDSSEDGPSRPSRGSRS
mmetsp:Transcript_33668/g.104551  ORF Transcript_33668/g.104551 Transcript_33668/m.104551 type:complete len:282 (+) Transcript_33668:837-1682(+)